MIDATLLLLVAGAVAVLAMGVAVAFVRPRTPASIAFAAFAILFGTHFIFRNLASGEPVADLGAVITLPASGVALVALAWVHPSPPPRSMRARLLLKTGAFPVAAAVALLAGAGEIQVRNAWLAAFVAFQLLEITAFALVALRFLRGEEPRPLALLTIGVAAFAGVALGREAVLGVGSGLVGVGALALVAAVWLAGGVRYPAHARVARNVALFLLASLLAGASVTAFAPGSAFAEGANGVGRLVMTLILAWAVVRHQLLGIDVKVRWGISRGTIAAAFIAVFFLASEGAQILFGGENEWVGLLAAGALVFAIAPLQRAAERLAERAVPVAHGVPVSPGRTSDREEAYRRAVRVAMRDRRLSREEERHLLDLAHHLDIPPTIAGRIHDDVEREAPRSEVP